MSDIYSHISSALRRNVWHLAVWSASSDQRSLFMYVNGRQNGIN
jgi:hypothetical protein